MQWNELYAADETPSYEDILKHIGEGKEVFEELVSYIEQTYKAPPQTEYSKCSAQPGWNLKYKKSGKSLCTLYPMKDHFIALVVVGAKEENEVQAAMPSFSPYVRSVYEKTRSMPMGRWLMIDVKQKEVLEDVKRLINIRVKPKKA